MLGHGDYVEEWEAKREWCRENGVTHDEQGGGDSGLVLTSTELDGIDHNQIALERMQTDRCSSL